MKLLQGRLRLALAAMATAVLAALGLITASGAASAATKAPTQLAAAGGSTLMPGEVLYAGQSLLAGNYTFAMQTDGNFVLYYGGSQALLAPYSEGGAYYGWAYAPANW